MKLPKLQGTLTQTGFFIYAACDEHYFDEFAVPLVNSIKKNTTAGIHLHIFNPRQDQLDYYSTDSRVSITYEQVEVADFIPATTNLKNSIDSVKYERSLTAMKKGNDTDLAQRVMKTYFACARFIRLKEIIHAPQQVFAIDIDALVRKEITVPAGNVDFFIHYIAGRKARFLAGGMFFLNNDNSLSYLSRYSDVLTSHIENDQLYWSLDQDVLDSIVPDYRFGVLPMTYIDWNMNIASAVWTAKGTRKDLAIFINEKKKYNS